MDNRSGIGKNFQVEILANGKDLARGWIFETMRMACRFPFGQDWAAPHTDSNGQICSRNQIDITLSPKSWARF